MFSDFTVDWKESLLILLGFFLIILLFYVVNRKSITKEKEVEKQLKKRLSNQRYQETQSAVSARKATPQVLQAYERLIILMERIDLQKLAVRVAPISNLKQDYATFLIQNIEQEYDFNISQQLYVSEEVWALIATAKQTIIQNILKTSLRDNVQDAQGLQRELLSIKEINSITDLAKSRLKQEFNHLV